MEIDSHPIQVSNGLLRIARLRDEYYDFITEPADFVVKLRHASIKADVFSFIQEIPDSTPRFSYQQDWDSAAVVSLTTFDYWWKKQINDKTRNMIRKAQKTGVELREIEFSDDLVNGIVTIYNECPVRQGRPFRHYGKSFETIKLEHSTFLDRSQFIGAFHSGQLIGFVKIVHGRGVSSLMNIISLISHRDKAPTNALISKAVEVCTTKGIPLLQYGTGNEHTIGDFKRHHAFRELRVPRYFVPLNLRGKLLLNLGLHLPVRERLPEGMRIRILAWRKRWSNSRANGAPAVQGRLRSTEPDVR